MKIIPNIISLSRVILSISLLYVETFSAIFYLIYVLCGITDVLDGFLARKTNSLSNFGARLDSFADLVMWAVILLVLYPVIKVSNLMLLLIAVVAIIRFSSLSIAFIKYASFSSIHTYGNKLTGIVLFASILLIEYVNADILLIIVLIAAILSAIEELFIQLFSKELDLDKKSYFL